MEKKSIKATVLKDFLDKTNRGKSLKKGDVIECSESRFLELKDMGLVEKENPKRDVVSGKNNKSE